jgi:signal transduction histidine kinase
MRRLLPQTALGQIVAIITGALALTFSLCFVLVFTFDSLLPPRPISSVENALAITVAVHALEIVAPADRPAVARAMSSPYFVVIAGDTFGQCAAGPGEDAMLAKLLQPLLVAPDLAFTLRRCAASASDGAPAEQLIVRLAAGPIEIRIQDVPPLGLRPLGIPLAIALLFLLLAVTTLSIWAAWRITHPLRLLAMKAEAFGQDIIVAPIPEQGPREIRQVAHAFNLMQGSIAAFMHDRSRMLAAVSHDLRTPLTRMKLRLQIGPSDEDRTKMLRDIGQLESMIGSALIFLRGQTVDEERDWTDVGALLATICDDYQEIGANITCEESGYLPCFCQPLSLRRAIGNLIENAQSHGTTIAVNAWASGGFVIVDIEDDGPGIAEEDKLRALQPFARLDPSRAATRGNVGLGLAIVHDVVRAHHGTIELLDRLPRGLTARLRLPAAP